MVVFLHRHFEDGGVVFLLRITKERFLHNSRSRYQLRKNLDKEVFQRVNIIFKNSRR